MNPDLVNSSYEAITNPILRLLVYFLAAAVVSLSTAVVYLFRKYIQLNEDSIKVLNDIGNSLDNISSKINA